MCGNGGRGNVVLTDKETHMSPSTIIHPRLARQPQRPLGPVTETQRPPVIIRPFAAPVVRELPPRRTAVGTAW